MKKLVLISLALMLAFIPLVKAQTGTIRISPALPEMTESPAEFTIWVEGAGNPTTDQHILLVMTTASFEGLSGDVMVEWEGGSASFPDSAFTAAKTGWVPTSGTTPGGRYTVASLQDHLGVPHSENIYYAHGSFLENDLTHDPQEFTVTLPSSDPRMLVYAIGKSEGSDLWDNKVPPTIPGFVVPELGPVLLATASFGALAVYAIKRRKAVS